MNLKFFSTPEDASNFEPFPLIFSRNSVAYEGNGALLASNQPGFVEGGKGVYGLGVFESYTNIAPANVSKPSTLTGFGKTSEVSDLVMDGEMVKGTFTGTSFYRGLITAPRINITGGQTYTARIRGKSDANSPVRMEMMWYEGSTWLSAVNGSSKLCPELDWVGVTGTAPANATSVLLVYQVYAPAIGNSIWWERCQLINKPYPLPWVLGGTTRQPEQCYIPIQEVKKFLDLKEGCIEAIINVNNVFKNLSTHNYIFAFVNEGITDGLLFYKVISTGDFIFRQNTINSTIPQSSVNNGMIPITCNCTNSNIQLQTPGQIATTASNPQLNYYHFYIGNRQDLLRAGNTNIKSIVFSKPRTQEERVIRQKFAEANGYYPIDDKVTAFIDLESGIRAYRRTNL